MNNSRQYAGSEPKRCSMATVAAASNHRPGPLPHNLNLHMYGFLDILALFQLEEVTKLTAEHMKHAKNVVLRMHPDKSRLSPDYFIFYKRAFDLVAEFYQQQAKVDQVLPEKEQEYVAHQGKGIGNGLNKGTEDKVKEVMSQMKPKDFNHTFNQLYDDNMQNREKQKKDQEQSQWFRDESDVNDWGGTVTSKGDLHTKFENIKQSQASQHLAMYRGVQTMHASSTVGGGNLYDDVDDGGGGEYITADPFSKLKYDDLRKVHKDQTVFAVSERSFDQMPQYKNVGQLQQSRGSQDMTPLDKAEAVRQLNAQEQRAQQQFVQREYAAKIQSMQYMDKNKQVMAHFLQLK
jgi:hypothetical protein